MTAGGGAVTEWLCMAAFRSSGCMLQDGAAVLEHYGREQQRAAAAAATAAAALGKGKGPAVPKVQKSALGPHDAARYVVAACQGLSAR